MGIALGGQWGGGHAWRYGIGVCTPGIPNLLENLVGQMALRHVCGTRYWRQTEVAMGERDKEKEGRDRLGFAKAVEEHVARVLATQGFVCTDTTPYHVSFRGPRAI